MQQLNQKITGTTAKGQVYKSDGEIIAELEKKVSSLQILAKQGLKCSLNNRRTAQQRAERILELERINGIIDSENDKLRETVRIQGIVIAQANKNSYDNAMRLPNTAMAAFILFIKMIFGGRA